MTAIASPASHAQSEPITGFSYVFAAEAIRQELTEQLDLVGLGAAQLVGDLVGSGSDTIRITRFGGLGFAETMTAMSGETDPIVPSGFTMGYDTVTIARYGLGKEQTYQDQILQRDDSISLEDMEALVPQTWMATLRSLLVTVGSTFSTSVSNTGVDWDYDAELELVAAFHETEGFDPMVHRPITIRHPEQYTDLRNAIRNEPGLQGDAMLQQALQGLGQSAQGGFNFLGFRNLSSTDVPTSAGDHVGCAYVPGALAWAVASTSPIRTANPASTAYIPEFGIILERGSEGGIATGDFKVNAWVGTAKLAAALYPQFKLLSVNN